jgi:hypothetical protein
VLLRLRILCVIPLLFPPQQHFEALRQLIVAAILTTSATAIAEEEDQDSITPASPGTLWTNQLVANLHQEGASDERVAEDSNNTITLELHQR